MEVIKQYFPNLTEKQIQQFGQLQALYESWNAKINVVSRKDMDNLYVRHILHGLAIAKYIAFKPGTTVMDLGTGGGFPAIPLAIFFPEVEFLAIDGIAKKIKVTQEVADELGLENITAKQQRVEENKSQFDFVVTRAVAKFDKLIPWTRKRIKKQQINSTPNGLIALKGGDLRAEMKGINRYVEKVPLTTYFKEPFFEEKYLIYVQL